MRKTLAFTKMHTTIIIALVLILLFPNNALSAWVYLEAYRPFGYERDTVSIPEYEKVALAKMDSISAVWQGYGKYQCPPKIVSRGSFKELMCVKYYSVWGCFQSTTGFSPLDNVFFNTCDNSIYHVNGSIREFNMVFGTELKRNYSKEFILRLIILYLNALSQHTSYLILGDHFDINLQFKNAGEPIGLIAHELDNIELIEKHNPEYMRPVQFEEFNDYIKVELNTFGGKNEIEHWVFRVFSDSLSLESRERIGTFSPYLYDTQNIFDKIGVNEDSSRIRFERYWDSLETKDSIRIDK